MKAEVVRCQGCSAALPYDGTQSVIVCEYCGTRNIIRGETRNGGSEALKKARHWMKLGKANKAKVYYRQAIDEDPFNVDTCREFLEVITDNFSKRAFFLSDLDDLEGTWGSIISAGADDAYIDKMKAYMQGVLENSLEYNHSDTFICTYTLLLESAGGSAP